MNYPVEAEDIIDAVPSVKESIFNVYNLGFMDGMKHGQALAQRAIENAYENKVKESIKAETK